MKKKVEKPNATEIVLDDKELTPIIRRMIEDAIQKGYSKTSVMNAMSQMWRDTIPEKKKNELELTADEQAFFGKVDMFFSEYGQAFVIRVSWKENGLNWRNREKIEEQAHNSDYAKHILDSLIMFTKSLFCTFCREDTITLANIRKYNMELWGRKDVLPSSLYPIMCALDDFVVVNGNKPVYALEKKDKDYENSIGRNEGYLDFIHKYSYRRTDLTEIAMKLIWIISTSY